MRVYQAVEHDIGETSWRSGMHSSLRSCLKCMVKRKSSSDRDAERFHEKYCLREGVDDPCQYSIFTVWEIWIDGKGEDRIVYQVRGEDVLVELQDPVPDG